MLRIFTVANVALFILQSSLFAGLRVDLRPVQPGPYSQNQIVDVNAFLVDTGNPQGAIHLRGVFFDFTDSNSSFSYPDPDGFGSMTEGSFAWIVPFSIGPPGFPALPRPSWVYPLPTPNPLFQITVPDNGEVQVDSMKVNVGLADGQQKFLDAMNDDVADPNFGARVDFGFGGPGDPVTTWRAIDGQLTGGVVEMTPIPEPGCFVLLTGGLMCLIRRRRNRDRI